MRFYILSVLSIAFLALHAQSQDWDSRYLVMSLSLGEVDPERSQNGLLFMSLYFDLEEEVQLSFPPSIEPVYAEIRAIIVPGNSMGEVLPGDPRYGSRILIDAYHRGDDDFDASLVGYNPIAPWYKVSVDTPILSYFWMEVWTTESPFNGRVGEALSRDPSVYHSPTGSYDVRGRVRTEDFGSASLDFSSLQGGSLPDVFVYNISFVGILPFEACAADVNKDGEINFFDVTAFIELYLVGCP